MSRRRKSVLVLLAAALALIAALVWYLRRSTGVEVRVEQARRGNITSTVTATGRVRPTREVQISSAIAGEIVELPVVEGENVQRGDLLVQLDRSAYLAEVRGARAALDLARAALNQSTAQWERAQALFERELISRQDLEASRTQFLLDQARVKQARASLDLTVQQLRETTITAPIGGTVTVLDVELGETVVPGTMGTPGTVLMVVADLSRMEVECDVDESDIARVDMGQPARIAVDALADTTLSGTVVKIRNAVTGLAQPGAGWMESPTVDYAVTVAVSDTVAALRPGMTANVDIITERRTDVVMIPIQAVIMREADTSAAPDGAMGNGADGTNGENADRKSEAVFIYEDGVARLVPVESGAVGEDYVEIRRGLSAGQEVITGPFSALREMQTGTPVEAERP